MNRIEEKENKCQTVMVFPPVLDIEHVKQNVAFKVCSMLEKGVRYFGSAGASLTHHANNPDFQTEFGKKIVQQGLVGERTTSTVIRKWMVAHPNAVLVDSCHIQGLSSKDINKENVDSDGDGPDTDHILIVGNTVFLIDSKRWRKNRSYKVNDKGVVQRGSKNKGYKGFPGGKVHAKQARFLWKKYYHSSVKNIVSIVCVSNSNVYVVYDKNWFRKGFYLTTVDKLPEVLNRFVEKMSTEEKTVVNSTIVAQTVVCCIKPFDFYTRIFSDGVVPDL